MAVQGYFRECRRSRGFAVSSLPELCFSAGFHSMEYNIQDIRKTRFLCTASLAACVFHAYGASLTVVRIQDLATSALGARMHAFGPGLRPTPLEHSHILWLAAGRFGSQAVLPVHDTAKRMLAKKQGLS